MRRVTRLASALLAGALVLTACGGSSDTSSTDTTPGSGAAAAAPPKSDLKVGLAYDIGGRGDQSFNDAAAAGLDKAKADLGVETKELEASNGEPSPRRRSACALLATAATTRSSRSASPTPAAVGEGRQGDTRTPSSRSSTTRQPWATTSPTCCSPRSRARSWSASPRR